KAGREVVLVGSEDPELIAGCARDEIHLGRKSHWQRASQRALSAPVDPDHRDLEAHAASSVPPPGRNASTPATSREISRYARSGSSSRKNSTDSRSRSLTPSDSPAARRHVRSQAARGAAELAEAAHGHGVADVLAPAGGAEGAADDRTWQRAPASQRLDHLPHPADGLESHAKAPRDHVARAHAQCPHPHLRSAG